MESRRRKSLMGRKENRMRKEHNGRRREKKGPEKACKRCGESVATLATYFQSLPFWHKPSQKSSSL